MPVYLDVVFWRLIFYFVIRYLNWNNALINIIVQLLKTLIDG